ncbi:MAG: discoidin domain-containing protein [Candidatus Sericytochromatia bacterium]|nr:discoidin domain-containing protein [Candidatus Sericytochromatia bacterium]
MPRYAPLAAGRRRALAATALILTACQPGSQTAQAPVAPPLETTYTLQAVRLAIRSVTASVNATNAGWAIDGNLASCWSSGPVRNPSFTAQLAGAAEISSLAIKANPVGSYAIQISSDGRSWRTVSTTRNTSWNLETKRLPAGTRGAHVRLQFSNGGRTVMVFELQPSGTLLQSPTPAPSTAPSAPPSATPTPVASSTPTAAPTMAPTTTPTAAPTVTPQPTTSTTPPPVGAVAIVVSPDQRLHPANSLLLGTNRNHAANDFPNGTAKLAKMRELTPQWGARKYLYRIGHGPTDGRYDYSYMTGFHFEQAWNKTAYPYDDLRYGLADAAALDAEQMHVVNYGTSTPEEAGRYVSYLNRAGDANRARYPVAQQNVRLFEIGNEIPWTMVRGHDQYAPNETVYAQRARLFAQQMRANSDVPIQIGAVASINSNWLGNGWSGGATTVKNILQIMGDQVDFLIYHGYPSWPLYKSGNLLTLMAQNEWNRQKIVNEILPAIKQYGGGRKIGIANTEFFTHLYSDAPRSRGLLGALYAADTVGLAFNLDMKSAVEFCFEHKELADAGFFFNHDPNQTTAIFKFQKLLAEHWGDEIVATSGRGIPSVSVAGASTTIQLPRLGFSAASSGNRLWVMVVNRLNDAPVAADVSVGFTPGRVTAYTLTDAAGWDATNATVQTRSVNSLQGYTFPKASVTILEIDR